jgi:hypothetical protein
MTGGGIWGFQLIRRPVVPAMYQNGVTVLHGGGNHSLLCYNHCRKKNNRVILFLVGGPIVTADKLVPSSRSSILLPRPFSFLPRNPRRHGR